MREHGPRLGDTMLIEVGTVADPSPEMLLSKVNLAKIKTRKLDMAIDGLTKQIEILQAEKEMLKEEYKF
jgi:hypothetical protein